MPSTPLPSIRTGTRALHLKLRAPPHLPTHRFSSSKAAPHHANYWSTDVYWGKAIRNIGNGLVLYVPVVACVMFWPTPIAPFFNLLKGVKNMERDS